MHNALHILTPITDCKFLYPIQDEWGSTPLIGACNATTAALLIENGAKVNYITKVRQFIGRDVVIRYENMLDRILIIVSLMI